MIFNTSDIINVDASLGHLPMVALEEGSRQVASSSRYFTALINSEQNLLFQIKCSEIPS